MWTPLQGEVSLCLVPESPTNFSRCHPLSLHGRMRCKEPCPKVHTGCGHPCQKLCGQQCGDCQLQLPPTTLRCGHETSMTCVELKSGAEVKCRQPIGKLELPCGHSKEVLCSTKDEVHICMEACGRVQACGHRCTSTCSVCRLASSHPSCEEFCHKPQACGHSCRVQ